MHPVLGIEEVLRCIFQSLHADEDGPRRRSLANLAVTCRTFSQPALEILWSHLTSLIPVVKCLPGDAYHEFVAEYSSKYGRGCHDLILIPKRKLVEADWKRFQFYAPFVKSYSSPRPGWGSGKVVITDELLNDLKEHLSNSSIFPNLETLSWYGDSETDATFSMFLAPNLLELTASLSLSVLLVFVRRACNRLRTVHVTTNVGPNHPDWISAASKLVVRLPTLERFRINVCLTDEAIAFLATCPNLKFLRIPNDASAFCSALQKKADGRRLFFSSLENLTVEVHSLPSLSSLLALCRLEKLIIIQIKRPSGQYPANDIVERVFAELANACSHDVLEAIVVENEVNYTLSSVVPPLLPPHVLKHLFVFKRLWMFNANLYFDLDDDTFEEMAISWPRLAMFIVKYDREHGSCPKITLRGLISLVKHCRDLYRVTMSLRISSDDLTSLGRAVRAGGFRNYHFKNIAFQDALIDDDVARNPVNLASFFNAVFPRLISVYVHSTRQTPVWALVNHALRPLRMLTAEEEDNLEFFYPVSPQSLECDSLKRYENDL